MKEAVEALTKNNKDCENKSLSIHMNGEMQAPYHWWYYYRYRQNPFANLSQSQVELIRTLTDWIDGKYSEIYGQTHDQFERGMVSEASMSFLIQPGDILIHRDVDVIEACLATTWPKKAALLSETETSAAKSQQHWNIDTWSYGFNGKLYKVPKTLNVKLDTDLENTEVKIVKLTAFPLRFAPNALRESLEQRGKTFWSCRYRKYVSYARESQDDFTVSFIHALIYRYVLLNFCTAGTALHD
jgi:hypothetical protein